MSDVRRPRGIRYWRRRAWRWLRYGGHWDVPCGVWSCPEGRVGFSHWCRAHTDEIVQHRKSPELVAELRRLGHDV